MSHITRLHGRGNPSTPPVCSPPRDKKESRLPRQSSGFEDREQRAGGAAAARLAAAVRAGADANRGDVQLAGGRGRDHRRQALQDHRKAACVLQRLPRARTRASAHTSSTRRSALGRAHTPARHTRRQQCGAAGGCLPRSAPRWLFTGAPPRMPSSAHRSAQEEEEPWPDPTLTLTLSALNAPAPPAPRAAPPPPTGPAAGSRPARRCSAAAGRSGPSPRCRPLPPPWRLPPARRRRLRARCPGSAPHTGATELCLVRWKRGWCKGRPYRPELARKSAHAQVQQSHVCRVTGGRCDGCQAWLASPPPYVLHSCAEPVPHTTG